MQKVERDATVESKRYGHFEPLLNSGRPDLLVTVLRLLSNPKENGLRKLVQNFERDPTVGLKVMAILTRY
jgi:precorrin-6B methylase 1